MAALTDITTAVRRPLNEIRARLRERRQLISRLEAELNEARRLNERIAALTDVVAEILIPASNRDDERVKHALEQFSRPSY